LVEGEAEVGEAEGCVGFRGSGEARFPLFPPFTVVGECLLDDADGGRTVRGELGDSDFLEESKVPLFLARDDLGDEERGTGGDGFLS
jgi:hypothetical protein